MSHHEDLQHLLGCVCMVELSYLHQSSISLTESSHNWTIQPLIFSWVLWSFWVAYGLRNVYLDLPILSSFLLSLRILSSESCGATGSLDHKELAVAVGSRDFVTLPFCAPTGEGKVWNLPSAFTTLNWGHWKALCSMWATGTLSNPRLPASTSRDWSRE